MVVATEDGPVSHTLLAKRKHTVASWTAAEHTTMYNCLVENIKFFPREMREPGIVAQLCRVLPAIELRLGGQVRRTRAQTNRWRDNAVWQDETFVFEVDTCAADLTVSCINTSGEGLAMIGATTFTLIPQAGSSSMQEFTLVRKSRTGSLVLAGTLQLQITYFSAVCHPKPSPATRPRGIKSTIAPPIDLVKPTEDILWFPLSSPAVHLGEGWPRRCSFPGTNIEGGCGQPAVVTRALLTTLWFSTNWRSKWNSITTKYNRLVDMTSSVELSTIVGVAVITGFVAFWLATCAAPLPAERPDTSVEVSDTDRSSGFLALYGAATRTDHRGNEYKLIVSVLAFGS